MPDVQHLPQPPAVTSFYLVLTREGPPGATRNAPPVPPAGLLVARGATPEQIAALDDRPHAHAIVHEGPLDQALEAERRALAEAHDHALAHDGVVIDAIVPRVLDLPITISERTRASDWFVFEHTESVITTHGLSRFGLPELRNTQSSPELLPMYDAVLVGVAQRLLVEWPEQDPIGPATITMRDIAHGYGDASAGGGDPTLDRSVDVTLRHDVAAEALDVVLHDDPAEALFAT